jgi:hypothetical protein
LLGIKPLTVYPPPTTTLELDEQVAVLAGVVAVPTAASGVASMRSYPETPEAPCRVTAVVGQDVDFGP